MKITTIFFDFQFCLPMIHFLLKSPLAVEEKNHRKASPDYKPHGSKRGKNVATYSPKNTVQ